MKRIVLAGVVALVSLIATQTSFAQVQVGFRGAPTGASLPGPPIWAA
ncbi:hypothetical protein [Spirosoma sp. KNUC1025]|nr:hypothetical protein LN737_07290 [Spirosoma sp. KNUC1025]